MKILQIHSFYPSYLNTLYTNYPELVNQSFDKQMESIFYDGFGAGHIHVPYLKKIGYDGNWVIFNNIPTQLQWLKENVSLEQFLKIKSSNNFLYEILNLQIAIFKPDILLIGDPINLDSKFIRCLTFKPAFIVGWRAANIPNGTDWSEFDLMLSNMPHILNYAKQLGTKNTSLFFPGFGNFIAEKTKNTSIEYDVGFSGQVSPEHSRRIELLTKVGKYPLGLDGEYSIGYFVDKQPLLPIGLNMYALGSRWGLEMYKALKCAKINLNISIDLAENTTGNMRTFEVTGVGSFLLTEHSKDIEKFFIPGKEIETFKSEQELKEKIYYYLEHECEREAIAQNGQKRCFQDYSMSVRAEELHWIIQGFLQKKINNLSKISSLESLAISELEEPHNINLRQSITIGERVQFIHRTKIKVGLGSCIGNDSWLNVSTPNGTIQIGNKVNIGRRNMLSSSGHLEIGDYCLFAPNVYVSNDAHSLNDIYQPVLQQPTISGRICIVEENCWAGINVVITGNLIIGRGSIIAANSVVNSDVPPFSLVAGSPAQIKKMYNPKTNEWEKINSPEDIQRILEIRSVYLLPNREEYKKILNQNARFQQIDPIIAGTGNI